MPEPSPSLFGAYFRRTGEDRLTEVLATVLQRTLPLANALAAEVGLPLAAHVEAHTQLIATAADRPDLEVRGYDDRGDPLWLLWSEHKTYTSFHGEQLHRYSTALENQRFAPERRLIAILLRRPSPAEQAEAIGACARLLSWDTVAQLAQRHRIRPGDPLDEWINFYKSEMGEPVAEPLTADRVAIAVEAEALWSALDDLTEHAHRAAGQALQLPAPRPIDGYWRTEPASGWGAEHGLKLFTEYDVHGEIGGKAAFKIGVYFRSEDAALQAADTDRTARLRDAGLGVFEDGNREITEFDVWGEVLMDEVAERPTLDEQRAFLAERCEAFFRPALGGELEALTAWPTRR